MVIDVNLQFSKQYDLMVVTPLPIGNVDKLMQEVKALFPRTLTSSGMTIEVNSLQ